MGIYQSISETIGKTPLISLRRYAKQQNIKANIVAKVEAFNPCGSIKDRAAYAIIRAVEKDGRLKPGGTIIEATSGNTGIALTALGTSLGYKVMIVMPDTMSVERRMIIQAYGAELVLTPGSLGMKGAISKAEELVNSQENAILAGQFINMANPMAHYETTGPEIWEDTNGNIDVFVAGVGTGGTISGAGRYLKEKSPTLKIIAVEPEASPVLSGGAAGSHKIQGIGAGFIPDTLETDIYDEVITVSNEEAISTALELGKTEGVLVGVSSGAALWAATKLAKRAEYENKTIVVVLPDTGERYLSMYAEKLTI